MRTLATNRTIRANLAILACALASGAFAWPNSARAAAALFCTWDGANKTPANPTNMIALEGAVCTESASNVSFAAQESAPGAPQIETKVPYTGFAFFAYYGGTYFEDRWYNAITVEGSNISITSYPAISSTYPGAVTAPYGVFSLGRSFIENAWLPSAVTFAGSTTVKTTSDAAFGLYAKAGGTISSTAPMTVTTGVLGASGLGASGVVADSTALVIPQSDTYPGLTVPAAPASVTLSGGGAVTTNGDSSAGLLATGSGAQITASAIKIVTNGTDSPGAQADTGGVIVLTGGSATTSGAGAVGVAALSGGSATLSDFSVSTGGQDAHGVEAGSGSQVSLSGASVINTQGAGAIGLYASQGGAISAAGTTSVTTKGGVSPTTGLAAYGVNADGAGSTVNLASATINTSGANATGLLVSDVANSGAAGKISITGPLDVQTTNPSATAIALQGNGATFSATGGGTIASAGGAIAFLGGANQTATFDNVSIANQSGDLIFADPSVATVNFNGVTANAGANNLLNATGGSSVTLNASASALTGAIRTDAASTTSVNLTNGSTWTMTGSSAVSTLNIANSYVVFAPPSAGGGFKTLTLNNYVGSGGYITMNATLGGSGSASDQIVINGGRAAGSTQTLVTIRNVGGVGGPTTGTGIPLIVTTNGGTIAPNTFALANTPVAGGFSYALEQTGDSLYLVSTPATTQGQMTNSITNVEKAQLQQLITGRVLGSILLGATEQINCSNCSSGFGSIGSYALGAHGRWSLTPEVTAMGGFSYDEYNASGITVTNAPTFAGSLVYDPINFGRSRPFFEVGVGVVPFEQVRYNRTYPFGAEIAQGVGNGIDRSLGLFGRVGWVDRVTPIDEAAIYTDISRSWLGTGGYSEASNGVNPFPATVATGVETLDVLRLGGQYTHLFGGRYEANVSAAVAYGFNSGNSSQWTIADYGTIAPYPIGNSVWYEWGARFGYRLSQRMVLDAFVIGTLGGQIGTTVHGGLGLRYMF